MDLSRYLENAPRGEAARVARDLAVSAVVVSHWSSGRKRVPVERATDLERLTGGAVRRWHSRPEDWYRIWPELVDAEGAPPVPDEEARDAA